LGPLLRGSQLGTLEEGYEVKLTIDERLTLQGILPKQGNIVTHRVIQSLRDTLGFTDEEVAVFQPTLCANINRGCVVCGGKGFDEIPHLPAVKCMNCGMEYGLGPPGGVVWRARDREGNELGDGSRDIDLSEAAVRLIVNTLKILNVTPATGENGNQTADGSLDAQTVPLYLKFVPEDEQQTEDTTPAAVEAAAG